MTRSSFDDLLSDDPFYTVAGNSISGSYIPAGSGGSGTGGTSTGSVISVNAGGITINLILDAAAQAAPASFKNGLQQAVSILAANITDKITVNINIDYSGTGGGAAAGPDNGLYESYAWTHSMLVNNASIGDTTFNSLPSGSTIQGQSSVAVWNAQLKLWGVIGANDTTTDDASAYFSTDINPNLLVGVALHELTHAMGRVPYGSAPDVFDFYRFTSPGVYLFQGGATAPASYFSLDNGVTKIADYGQNSDPSDFLNGGVQGPNDPFNEYYTTTTIQGLTTVDLKQLDALGFHLAINSPTTIESYGSTTLVRAGNNYFMNATAGAAGPTLKYGGGDYYAGEIGNWTPIGVEKTATGYEVAWKVTGADQYTVWNADSNGNYVSSLVGVVSGSNPAFEALETSFQQDLNGDGTIGVATSVVEALGSTKLVEVGTFYYLNPVAGGTGPTLKYGGSDYYAGEIGNWTPIGVEKTATGYEVAWKVAGADQYTVWNADNNGNYVSSLVGVVSGSNPAFEALETSFQQDLNGDGTIGAVPSVVEALGSTKLVEVGTFYYLNPVAGGTGPTLKYGGGDYYAGEIGNWTPIGVEKTATGYEVAWKVAGADQYTVWNADNNGNYVSSLVGVVSGSNPAFEALETSFQQDLNGDGTIGVVGGTQPVASAAAAMLLQHIVGVSDDGFLFPQTQHVGGAQDVVGLFKVGASSLADQFAVFAGEQSAIGLAHTTFDPVIKLDAAALLHVLDSSDHYILR
jgi:20S proteasome alpha/beta subunit